MTNRRSFLAGLAVAFVADPERLLWVPGKKLISIPKPSGMQVISITIQVNGAWSTKGFGDGEFIIRKGDRLAVRFTGTTTSVVSASLVYIYK